MARINVTLPDELAALVRDEMPGLNVSGVLQEALQQRVDCDHRTLGCSCCGAHVVRRELEGAILHAFLAEAMWRLREPVSRCATAEGAARVLRDLARNWEVPDVDRVPLPRPTKSQRARAGRLLMGLWDAQREKSKGEIGSTPRCSTCGTRSVLDPCRSCQSTAPLALFPSSADSLRRTVDSLNELGLPVSLEPIDKFPWET